MFDKGNPSHYLTIIISTIGLQMNITRYKVLIAFLCSLILLCTACLPTPTAPVVSTTGTPGGSLSWLQVYFTDPNPPDNLSNGIDRFVIQVLNAAQHSIDVASFDFNLSSVTTALVNASQRGVKVRVVLDLVNGTHELKASESTDRQAFDSLQTLKAAHIRVVDGGRSNGLMHDKMIIVDGVTLFMGSWNMSYNDTFRNNNNLLDITDPSLIANYQAKFDELFVDKHFGTKAQVGALRPRLSIDNIQVENYFSPVDEVMSKLIALVNSAQKSIRVVAFTYTDTDLAGAMITQYKAGLRVEGVIESRGATRGALVPLFCAGLPVKMDGNKYTMHHKVIIIDDSIVVTGSFNFTQSADTANDDNVLIIHNPAIAGLYNQEFDRVNSIARTPTSSDFTCNNK